MCRPHCRQLLLAHLQAEEPDREPRRRHVLGDVQRERRLAHRRPRRQDQHLPALQAAEHLVELVSYHVRIDEQLTTFREIKDEFVTKDFPAWTILGVASLARPNLLIEIKAVAAAK